jgi:hypothetical protein
MFNHVAFSLYPPTSVANVFGNGFMVLISDFERLLGWERLLLYGRYVYVEMTRFLMVGIFLYCRLSTDVQEFYVCGHLCSGWRTETFLCCTRLEATARDTFSLHGW